MIVEEMQDTLKHINDKFFEIDYWLNRKLNDNTRILASETLQRNGEYSDFKLAVISGEILLLQEILLKTYGIKRLLPDKFGVTK